MKATVKVSGSIDVAHQDPVWFTCSDGLHGHTYGVEVVIAFDPATAELFSTPPHTALFNHLAELHGRNLNEMIRPARPNHYGLAAWVYERMQVSFEVISVLVSTDDCEVRLWPDEVPRK